MAMIGWDTFRDAVGRDYAVEAGGATNRLTLVEATAFDGPGREGSSFRLEFLGPADPLLPQGTYPFAADGETCEIFVVPISRDETGTRYEAIFN